VKQIDVVLIWDGKMLIEKLKKAEQFMFHAEQ